MHKDIYLRMPSILEITGLSASTIYRLEKDGLFPTAYRIGKRAKAWRRSEIESWIHNKTWQKSKDGK